MKIVRKKTRQQGHLSKSESFTHLNFVNGMVWMKRMSEWFDDDRRFKNFDMIFIRINYPNINKIFISKLTISYVKTAFHVLHSDDSWNIPNNVIRYFQDNLICRRIKQDITSDSVIWDWKTISLSLNASWKFYWIISGLLDILTNMSIHYCVREHESISINSNNH